MAVCTGSCALDSRHSDDTSQSQPVCEVRFPATLRRRRWSDADARLDLTGLLALGMKPATRHGAVCAETVHSVAADVVGLVGGYEGKQGIQLDAKHWEINSAQMTVKTMDPLNSQLDALVSPVYT